MKYCFISILLFVYVNMTPQSLPVQVSLDHVINRWSLESSSAHITYLNYENELLHYENYKKGFLPSVSVNMKPFSFNRSLVKLQQAEDGQYHYVEDYSSNSSLGLNIRQKVGLTGGDLTVISSLNYLNEMSNDRHSFSSVPFSFSYSQQLFGSRKSLRMSREIEEKKNKKSVLEYCTKMSDIQQQAITHFMTAFLAQLEMNLSKNNWQSTDTLLRIATVKYEKGNLTEQDFRQMELQALNDQYTHESAVKSYDEAIQAMITYLSLPYETKQLSIETPPFNLPLRLELQEVLHYVTRNNPESLNRDISGLEAEKNFFTARLNNLINSDINLSYGINQYAHKLIDAYRNPSRQQGVSIGLSIPIFQWGINRNNARIAKNTYRSSQITMEQERLQFEDDIKNKVNNYNHTVNLWFISEKTYHLSQTQYQLLTRLFSMGKASVHELINSHQQQSSAMQKYYNAVRDLWDSYLAIRKATLFDFKQQSELIELFSEQYNPQKNHPAVVKPGN